MPVVMQPRLSIKILPFEPERITNSSLVRRLADRFLRLSPRLVLRRPGNITLPIRQLLRRTQMVALIKRDLILPERLGLLLILTVPQRIKRNVVLAVITCRVPLDRKRV